MNRYLLPVYFENFKCKGSNCRHNCCHSFCINYTLAEYEKIKSSSCGSELKNKIEKAFIDNNKLKQKNSISLDENGYCPLLEDGLCLIHKELGEEFLTKTCRIYPRFFRKINDEYFCGLFTSCEKVVEILYEMEHYNISYNDLDVEPELKIETPDNSKCIIDKYIKIFENKNYSLSENIRRVCIEDNEELFNKQISVKISPLSVAIYLLNKTSWNDSNIQKRNICDEVSNRYLNNYTQYEKDKKEFIKRFPEYEVFFKNVILNSLYVNDYPRVDRRMGYKEAYNGLCVTYGLLMIVSVGYTSIHTSKEDLIDAIATTFRVIDHTDFYFKTKIICDFSPILLKL